MCYVDLFCCFVSNSLVPHARFIIACDVYSCLLLYFFIYHACGHGAKFVAVDL